MEIKKAAVIGSGTMGNGIAHVLALSGFPTFLIDVEKKFLDKAFETVVRNLDRQVAKGVITEKNKQETLSKIQLSTDMNAAREVPIVIEAVPENRELKKQIFLKLDSICSSETILASNTSSISITALAGVTKRPAQVIGMHFMNPVPVMQLVEIVRGFSTSDETYEAVRNLALRLKKTPVCSKDFPGFISNRILMPMINEACYVLMEGVAAKEDIDTVMKLGMNHPVGPLALADAIGLDVCLAIMEVLYRDFSDSKYRPCPLLRQMVQAGLLGRKSGRGFYNY